MPRQASTLLVLAVVLCAHVMCAVQAAAAGPVVTTASGKVQGYTEGTINVFRGIPYAQPPVGDLRFRAPVKASPWAGTLNATGLPPVCAQVGITGGLDGGKMVGQEDCLTLNVFTPSSGSDSNLPVMLWIYGGGWVEGDSWKNGKYDGTNMATQNNVVVVAINYRLGAFGFLSLPELQTERAGTGVGSMGLMDQRMAFQWVQDNIEAFGGDKTRVAIFGESAGGFSVCYHLASPLSKGLFSAAVMESGTCESVDFFTSPDSALTFGSVWSDSVNCKPGPSRLSCLRNLTAAETLSSTLSPYIKGSSKYTPPAGVALPAWVPLMPWAAVVDGVQLLDVPLTSIKKGIWADVPVIMGTNLNEGTIFVPLLPTVIPGVHFPPDPDEVDTMMRHFFQFYTSNTTLIDSIAQDALSRYPLSDYGSEWRRSARIMTDWFFTCGTRRAVRAIAGVDGAPWLYHFTQDLGWLEYKILGDYHSSEIDLVFGNQYPIILGDFTKADRSLSNAMQYYWTNMAAVGQPNSASNPFDSLHWPQYGKSSINMNLTWPLVTQQNLAETNCDFWDDALESFAMSD